MSNIILIIAISILLSIVINKVMSKNWRKFKRPETVENALWRVEIEELSCDDSLFQERVSDELICPYLEVAVCSYCKNVMQSSYNRMFPYHNKGQHSLIARQKILYEVINSGEGKIEDGKIICINCQTRRKHGKLNVQDERR